MSAAVVIRRTQRYYMRVFREAGALDANNARSPHELGIRTGWVFRRMARAGAFVEVSPGCYYMDQAAAEGYMAAARRRALILLGLFLLVYLLLALFFWSRPPAPPPF